MIPLARPSTGSSEHASRARSSIPARSQSGRPLAGTSTCQEQVLTEKRPRITSATWKPGQIHSLTVERGKGLQRSSASVLETFCGTFCPAGHQWGSTTTCESKEPDRMVKAASSDLLTKTARSTATQNFECKDEKRDLSTATRITRNPAANGDGQEKVPDVSFVGSQPRKNLSVLSVAKTSKEQPGKPIISARLMGRQSHKSRGSHSNLIKLGIETEFYLAGLDPMHNRDTLTEFLAVLAQKHNRVVPALHPRMQEGVRPYAYEGPYTEWCMVEEESLASNWIPWGIEMVSPILRAFPDSMWRGDVEATWRFLSRNYDIVGNHMAGTHIHVGFEPEYSLTDLKRIAQAVIHFETAFEALVPRTRRGNRFIKSNWLDAPGLARKGLTRGDSIAAIGEVSHFYQLLDMLHPMEASGAGYDRFFAWNFYSWYTKRSVEFRKPPICTTSKEALSWAELAMSFVQASAICESAEALQKVPPPWAACAGSCGGTPIKLE